MPNQSIPTGPDSEVLPWTENFATVFGASPTTYGFTSVEATDVTTAVENYRDAYDIAGVAGRVAVNPGGYTQPNRAALMSARAAALSVIRPLAVQIQANPGISDEDKLDAGIVPRNFSRTPVLVPETSPVLTFLQAGVGTHLLAFADQLTPSRKTKPFGAIGLQLYRKAAASVSGLDELEFHAMFSRNAVLSEFDAADAGKICTYAARWVGTRGDVGPWSALLTATVLFSEVPGP